MKNRVNKEGDEDVFQENFDKNDIEDSDVHKNINEQENKNEEKTNLHGKPGDVSEKLNFTDSESDPSDGYDNHHLCKHSNFYEKMAFFDNTTVKIFQLFFIETY